MHRLLEHQTKRFLHENSLPPPGWDSFLASVEEAYASADTDRKNFECYRQLKSMELDTLRTNLAERQLAETQLEHLLSLLGTTLESTSDGIMVLDKGERLARFNQRFIEMWHIPDDISAFWEHERMIGCICAQLKQPQAFLARIDYLCLHPAEVSLDLVECLDGRLMECYSLPHQLGDSAVGRVFSFRDITERKRGEEALRHEKEQQDEIIRKLEIARKQAEEEMRNLAFYDPLTKLPNRSLFLDRFRAALPISARNHNFGAVLYIDMDRFKLINDTLGHDYGDLLLIEVANRIKSCVREMDTVARLGGDEFAVLVEGLGEDQVEASRKVGHVAEKIRAAFTLPCEVNGHEFHTSPSIGINLYRGNEEPIEALLQHADMAMYQAKKTGRDAIRFFDPIMQHNVMTHAALEHDLRHAVAGRQLHLHYQMQVDNDQRVVGAEALLRWIHPLRGMVMPGQFIPIAEESTLIIDLGHWVLETACRQLVLWGQNEKTRDLTLAVNVSAKQFAQQDFVAKVAEVLTAHRINPALLKLELTESIIVDDLAQVVSKMQALKNTGIKLSLDDFGTGYSSLSYLKQLPLDQLKIDQSFVRGITKDGNDALLVKSIIELAGDFHLNVIAEGVETEAQLAFLKHHDCMSYQGYLFSKPVPLEEFEALLGGMQLAQEDMPCN
jgi:diguanylate cyclase (GGDEF)-like protein